MTQKRMLDGLQLALSATRPDPQDRYLAAMIQRAQTILVRAHAEPDPSEQLDTPEAELVQNLRERADVDQDISALRRYVVAKLKITNPSYLDEG